MIKIKTIFKDSILALFVLGIIIVIIIPLPSALLDMLLIINISIAVIILLTSLYVKEPLEFSTFPSVLLIVTLFRLSLNISTTRLILSNNGEAGKVIETFGHFVVQDNIVVGLIIFLIIIIIQFIVITKGAERVSEVAARFTLDSMPGKQMAIDADLNSGLIDEKQAKIRRKNIQKEADFYGSMDGASKFVKGDTIAGIIITIINLVGGLIIGVVFGNMESDQVFEIYSLATVGDGLVSQLPALLISTATGIITTRSASENNLNKGVAKQLFSQHNVLIIGGIMLITLNFIPGLPHFPLIITGLLLMYMSYKLKKEAKKDEEEKEDVTAQKSTQKAAKTDIMDLIFVDPVVVEFGYSIIPLVDEQKGGDLLDRVVMIRRQYAAEMGMVIPVIRFKDNMSLKPNQYVIRIKGVETAGGEVLVDHVMAMNAAASDESNIEGIDTVEPAFGMEAKWIRRELKEKAEIMGYTLIDPSSVIATHIFEVVKKNSYILLGRQEVKDLIDNLKKKYPALVEEIIPDIISLGTLQKVLSGLLKENIAIRNLASVLETLGDYGKKISDTNMLIEYARHSLKREITQKYAASGRIDVITIAPKAEEMILKGLKGAETGSFPDVDPDYLKKLLTQIQKEYKKASDMGIEAVLICSPLIRFYIRELIVTQANMDIPVLSLNELEPHIEIQVVGTVNY